MSDQPTLVTADHFAYITERTRPEPEFLRKLKLEARKAGIPPIWISWHQASLMQILLKLNRAQQVVEVGTLAGYSAIAMALALPRGGMVHTIELDAKHADFAQHWISKSDAHDRITLHRGAGSEVLKKLKSNSADACFLDADKASYPLYLDECMRIVRSGGLIMADNAFAFGQLFDVTPTDREAGAIKKFNDVMAKRAGLHGLIVPVGDGLWVAHKE
ncbi:MAG: O-methyltransferase [Planctomycetes bacterium]|nr:O-methyltransferase [Planctomycetota bacterium]